MSQTATSNKLTHITIDSPFGNSPYNGLTPDYYCAPGLVAGSGNGTFSNPWSIDMISNISTIAGKIIGLKNGTYELYTTLGLPGAGDFSGGNWIGIVPGTATVPTIIVSESPHGAIIDGQRDAIYAANPSIDWGMGLLGPETFTVGNYGAGLIIDGLLYTGGNYRFITNYGGAYPAGRGGNGNNGCDNLTIRNCYFTNLSYITSPTPPGRNSCAVYSEGSYHIYIQNCYFEKIDAPCDQNRTACIQFYSPTIDTIVEYVTCIGTTDAGNLVYWKCGPSPGHQGAICRFNFLDISAATDTPGPGGPIMADGSTVTTDVFEVYNNILKAGNGMPCIWLDNSGAGASAVNTLDIHNNTLVGNWSNKGMLYDTAAWSSLPNGINFYNNILTPSSGGGAFGDFDVPKINLIANVNYNLYPTPTVNFGVGSSVAYTTLAAWQSATSSAGFAADTNSVQANPQFVANATDATYYQLSSGSPALTMASDGGEIGAWRPNGGIYPNQRGGGSTLTFDYYISSTGDDNNAGTLTSPWSITALNSKQSIYASKRIGLIAGLYQYGIVGGTKTSLYSLMQIPSAAAGPILALQGGSPSSPTYIASCDNNGIYSRNYGVNGVQAIIDCADPVSGAQPTVENAVLGQYDNSGTNVTKYGYATVDGLVIRNFTFAALLFQSPAVAPWLPGITIKNCELYNQQNVVSNNNPGAIWLEFADGAIINNCKVHDLKSNASGTSSTMQACGFIQFNQQNVPTDISYCTFYNGCAISNKDSWQRMNVSYCYCGWGTFGVPTGTSIGGTIHNYLTASGSTVAFHHNILLGPVLGWGESTGQPNKGSVLMYNNTFYMSSNAAANYRYMCAFDGGGNGSGGIPPGTWSFYNNLIWSVPAAYDQGDNYSACLAFPYANATPSTIATCDYNAYGTQGPFSSFEAVSFNPIASFTGAIDLATWKGLGFDTHSVSLTANPFDETPKEALYETFAISPLSTAYTAGVGGAICGAIDNSNRIIGANF